MIITCLDLEGVLVPEVWINVAEKTGIEALKLTTRDIQDYDELMTHRLKVIAEHKLTLSYIQEVIGTLSPFEGAIEFLDWLRTQSQVVILSDTFEEFAQPLMKQLKMPTILCHNLSVDSDGKISDYHLRLPDPKKKAIQAFKSLNYKTIAAGDSYNDVSMLLEADRAAFFKPPQSIADQFPQLPVARDYEAFQTLLEQYFKELAWS